ncbi:RDD family protein [Haladaptatus sp. NG-WS-4]
MIVVKRNGNPCTIGASIIRNALRTVCGIAYYAVTLVAMLVNDDRQRIGDLAADTVVVRAR